MTKKKGKSKKCVSLLLVSGFNFPSRSRSYLPGLVGEIAKKEKVGFIVIAGNMLAGKELDASLKQRYDERLQEVALKDREEKRKEIAEDFIYETAADLDKFLPHVNNIRYHIVVAEKVYDRPIGVKVLNVLAKLRDDIRIYDNPEAKFTIQLPGFGEARVIVPRKTPWFYDNVTGLMQRLINGFAARTFSPPPGLILVGCTGVGAFIPRYKGIPAISAPTCHKIDEQVSTENMVGCVVVRITKEGQDKFKILPKFYDFRTAIFRERDYALPKAMKGPHREVLEALKPGSTSITSIRFRINHPPGKHERNWTMEKTRRYVDDLVKRNLLTYSKRGNNYDISEYLNKRAPAITLEQFLEDGRELTQVVKSCWHVGALKTLYNTVLKNEPNLAEDADAIVSNGDIEQGISHNYEYNGELLPIMNGADKHGLLAAKMQAWIINEVFERRLRKLKLGHVRVEEVIEKCLIPFYYKHGNHDEPRFSHSKYAVPLMIFDIELRRLVLQQTIQSLANHGLNRMDIRAVEKLVNAKIVRVGESRVAKIKGIPVGVKHPFQARTKSKGIRIQETANFFLESLKESPDKALRNVPIVLVANFHEAAAICSSAWGKTIVGIMTPSQLYDTSFESNQNKVVEHGLAKAKVCLNPSGQVLWVSVEYSMDIVKEDRKIALSDSPTNKDVSELCTDLSERFDMPWR